MIRRKKLPLLRGEVAISRVRLDELEQKERAHDAYLRASKVMGLKAKVHQEAACLPYTDVGHAQGWLACLREFDETVLAESWRDQ